jgi:hypothetical protein
VPIQPSPTGAQPRPMVPSNPLVMASNAALADPDFRASVRQMHAEGYPLVKMVDALGLEDDMTPQVRKILEDLPPHVVANIRKAVLAMLDSTEYEIPLNCTVTDAELETGHPVHVEVEPEEGRPTIHVRPAS